LTNREYEILSLIAQGMSNKMIARELDISDGTVKVHVKHLLKKLGLRSRVEAAVWMVNQQDQ
jgi:two-component system nitrate/nitrite response regulator NarL